MNDNEIFEEFMNS